MTEQAQNPLTAPGHGAAKGLALGLGILLLGGTALLITLLIVREPERPDGPLPPLSLEAGERVVDISLSEEEALLLVEAQDGTQRLILVDLVRGNTKPLNFVHE